MTTYSSEHLLVRLLPVDYCDLVRPCMAAAVGVLLLVWISLGVASSATDIDSSTKTKKKATKRWTLDGLRSLVEAVADRLETATTGSASPPLPDALPRPGGLPFLGYLPWVGRLPHISLARVAARYAGRAFRLAVGCRRYVVISRIETVRELARRYPQQLRGKPRTFTTEQMTLGAHNDLVQRWKRRRAYTEAGLKTLERTTIAGTVGAEVKHLVADLERFADAGTPSNVRHSLAMYAARTMYRVAYGRVPNRDAVAGLSKLVDAMPDYTTTIGSLSWFDVLPFWRRVRAECFRKFVDFNRSAAEFCRRAKQFRLAETEKLETTTTGNSVDDVSDDDSDCGSLLDFFRKRWSRMTPTDVAKFSLTDEILYDGLEDIIRAGTESTSLLLKWFVMYVAAFPEVQRRMRAEIDEYFDRRGDGSGADLYGDDDDDDEEQADENNKSSSSSSSSGRRRRLNADDVSRLPYCRAALMEAFRFSALNPFLKRELTDDIVLPAELGEDEGDTPTDQVRLPRGTVLLYNTWAMNNDRRHWTDPDQFRPERFLRSVGVGAQTDVEFDESKLDLFVPFGFGKRRCIGVDTGRVVCLLAVATAVDRFDIRFEADARPVDMEPIFGIGLAPKDYRVVLTRRQNERH